MKNMLCLKETERLHFIVDIIYFFMFLHKGKRTILILKCVENITTAKIN